MSNVRPLLLDTRNLPGIPTDAPPNTATPKEVAKDPERDQIGPNARGLPSASRRPGLDAPSLADISGSAQAITGDDPANPTDTSAALLQMLSTLGSSDQLSEMTPEQLMQSLANAYPQQQAVYSGLSISDLDALLTQMDQMNDCAKKHMLKAAAELAEGDISHAKKELTKALRDMGKQNGTSGPVSEAQLVTWMKELAPYAELIKMKPLDIAQRLQASFPGAAPMLKHMEPMALLQILSRIDAKNNQKAQGLLDRAGASLSAGDTAGAEKFLQKAAQELGVGGDDMIKKLIKHAIKEMKHGDFDEFRELLLEAANRSVVRGDMSSTPADLNTALKAMGRPS